MVRTAYYSRSERSFSDTEQGRSEKEVARLTGNTYPNVHVAQLTLARHALPQASLIYTPTAVFIYYQSPEIVVLYIVPLTYLPKYLMYCAAVSFLSYEIAPRLFIRGRDAYGSATPPLSRQPPLMAGLRFPRTYAGIARSSGRHDILSFRSRTGLPVYDVELAPLPLCNDRFR